MIEKLIGFLNQLPLNQSIAIAGHVRPDGDALGSMFGLGSALKDKGHSVCIILPEGVPSEYQRLLPSLDICSSCDEALEKYNITSLFAVDTANFPRLNIGACSDVAELKFPIYVIDHHVDNHRYGVENFVMNASATAEIIADVLYRASWYISAQTATALLMGILRDTGCFRFGNTSPSALRMSAIMMEAGAEYQWIIEDLWFSRPLKQVQGETDIVLNHTAFFENGSLAVICASDEVLQHHGITLDSSDDLLDQVRSIKGVEVVAFIMNISSGTKISFRSKHRTWPVGPTARRLGGGGHDMAASATLPFDDFNSITKRVVEELILDRQV